MVVQIIYYLCQSNFRLLVTMRSMSTSEHLHIYFLTYLIKGVFRSKCPMLLSKGVARILSSGFFYVNIVNPLHMRENYLRQYWANTAL